MRYFTRGWATGELTDEESAAVEKAYAARLREIAPRLAPDLLRLTRELSLHDGLIERITWSPATRHLEMRLVCGDQQRGYHSVQLGYGGAQLGDSRLDALRRAALSRETELLYDEVDIGEEGLLCHRLLFWPNEEVTIEFETCTLVVLPRPNRRVERADPFVVDEPGGS